MNKKKILLVDDEVEFCQILKKFFIQENFKVECSHDGESAFNKTLEFQPDLVLLDIRMPNADGLYFLEKIKRLHSIRIIAVTAIQDSTTMNTCRKLGVSEFMSKPVDLMDLRSKVEKILQS